MSSYLYRLAAFSFRRRALVAVTWLLVAVGAITLAVSSGGRTDDNFTIPGTESQRMADALAADLPAASGAQTTIVFAGTQLTRPATTSRIVDAIATLRAIPQVSSVADPFRSALVSPTGTVALGQVQWSVGPTKVSERNLDALEEAMRPLQADGIRVEYGGTVHPHWRSEISETPELIGLGVAFVVLLVAFGSGMTAGVPVAGAIVGVICTLMTITALSSVLTIATAASTVALMLGLSCGIDYGLFILSRHRTNLLSGMPAGEAAALAVGTAGGSVVFAALTVIVALCGLTVVGIPFLTTMGLAAAGAVLVALLIALTLLPAMLGFAGQRVAHFTRLPLLGRRAQRVARRTIDAPHTLAGARWARFVVRRRRFVLIGGLLLLGVIAAPASRLELGLPSAASQPESTTQRQAYDLITQGFGPGFNAALLVLAEDAGSPTDLARISAAAAALPDVAHVSTLVVQGGTALIQVIPASAPDDAATTRLVHALRHDRSRIEQATGTRILIGGTTASNIDVSAKLASALPVFMLVVIGLAFVLLTFAFRTILVPIKSIVGFLLSMGAALGAQVAIFQWGWGERLFGETSAQTISFLPIIMLAIVFGLSSDYEVFVVSRIKEEYASGIDAREAVQRGTGLSARVVTAAALIMFFIFVSFMLTDDPVIKAIGFSFAAGVFLDAFVVRLTLVPAVMAIVGSRLWHHPAWYDRRVPDPDIEGRRLAEFIAAEHALVTPLPEQPQQITPAPSLTTIPS